MLKLFKKKILFIFLFILSIDIFIGVSLFKSRFFSHLAFWNIIESVKQEDFYWQPQNAPSYFRFEPEDKVPIYFKGVSPPAIDSDTGEFNRIIEIARTVTNACSISGGFRIPFKWDSPEGILKQARAGVSLNCFQQAILFSAYLSGSGIKSRLWALENNKFDKVAHTINEIYVKSLKKWVFMDIISGFYFTENNIPLSFLELREKILNNNQEKILMQYIGDQQLGQGPLPSVYRGLVKCSFLRANNAFIDKYSFRYGVFSGFSKYIDKLPNKIRIGLDYLLGQKDIFVHYVDKYSGRLVFEIIMVKLFFYFFIFSLIAGIIFLIHKLSINKQKKSIVLSNSKKRSITP